MHSTRGFTLIELLAALAIAGALLAASASLYANWMGQYRLTHDAGSLLKVLRLARSYAIASGLNTVVCKSETGDRCGGSGYEKGWLVFIDRPGLTKNRLDAGERILQSRHGESRKLTIRANTFSDYIAFNARGHSRNGRFVLCSDNNVRGAAALVVSRVGRIRLAGDSNGDGIPEVNGENIGNCLS